MKITVPDPILPMTELGHVHFIGIGGAGLSAIARLMAASGVVVSGSDQIGSSTLDALCAEGIDCFVGHLAEHLDGVDTVIVSTAVRDDHPQVIEAQRRSLRIWPRSAALQSVLLDKRVIAVAGTHGKTTTTAMLTMALQSAGRHPSFAIGAEVASLGTNARLDVGDLIVAEADESDGAFLVYTPTVAVVTNVDADHLDNYGTTDAYEAAFAEFLSHVEDHAVICSDDPGALRLLAHAAAIDLPVTTAGFDSTADFRGTDLRIAGSHTTFSVRQGGRQLGTVELQVPGQHYAIDALLAIAAGMVAGSDFEPLAAGLATYAGAKRRMEPLGVGRGVRVFDSYAHHPTEIRADIAAARAVAGGGRLIVAFQPHLVSRTRIFGTQMGAALNAADVVVVTDIYLAREDPDPKVTSALVLNAVVDAEAHAGVALDGLPALLTELVRDGDLLLTLGAGDITTVGPKVLALLQKGDEE